MPSNIVGIPRSVSAQGRVSLHPVSGDPAIEDKGNALLKAKGKLKVQQTMNPTVKKYIRMMKDMPTGT